MTSSFAIGFLTASTILGVLFVWRVRAKHDHDGHVLREAIPSYRRSQAKLEAELARVRRYDHPLAIMVVRVPDESFAGNPSHVFAGARNGKRARHVRRMVNLHIGTILHDCLRASDLPMWDTERNQYVVALPECDQSHAQLAADRLQRLVPTQIGAAAAVGIAEFPADGLALELLVTKAEERCESQSAGVTVPTRSEPEAQGALEMVEGNVVEPDGMDRRAQSG